MKKKRSAKASVQRDDRAFAEFEALTRKLVKQPTSQIDAQPADAKVKRSTH